MGGISSNTNQHLEKELGADYPEGEVFVGFENYNNICYANSIIQAFFQCNKFRMAVLGYKKQSDNVISLTQELFSGITKQKKKTGVTNIKKLISYAKRKNEGFKGDYHQDCHEFFMWYINEIDDALNLDTSINSFEQKKSKMVKSSLKSEAWQIRIGFKKFSKVFKQLEQFAQTVKHSEREEPFFSLSIDIEPNTSLSHCIKKLSKEETMNGADKFHCDNCQSKQDASQRLLIKKLPITLIIHFKRFKYDDKCKQMVKLSSKIPFPFDLKIKTSYSEVDSENSYKYYDLLAIIAHYGQGVIFGHYLSIIKIEGKWFIFDDDQIQIYSELEIYCFYGRNFGSNHTGCAYMLFYNEKKRE